MDEVKQFLLENQETIIKDMYPDISQRMKHVGFFRGTDRDIYLNGVAILIQDNITMLTTDHYPNVSIEDLLIVFEDEHIKTMVASIQEYFLKEMYANKNSLH